MTRILCVCFPNWPIQRRQREQPAPDGSPLVLYAFIGGKARVTACSRSIRRYGVLPGMLLAEAQALIPFLPSLSFRDPTAQNRDMSSEAPEGRQSIARGVSPWKGSLPALSPGGATETVGPPGLDSAHHPHQGLTPLAINFRPFGAEKLEAAIFEPHDPAADRAALQTLAAACSPFSPRVAIDTWEPPDSLLLDVTGCGYNFGGERELAEHVLAMLRQQGYAATVAIADTIGAAWATAHFSTSSPSPPASGGEGWGEGGERPASATALTPLPPSPLPQGEGRKDTKPRGESSSLAGSSHHLEALRPLPVQALRLSANVIALLHEFDVRRIGQLLELPRAQLPSRFGPELLLRLDQALGNVPELLLPERPAENIEAAQVFEPPIADRQVLEAVLEQLLEEILRRLLPWQLGVRRLRCALDLALGEPLRFEVELLRPSLSLKHLAELLRLHVERLTVPAEVARVALRAAAVASLEFQQAQMFDDEGGPQRQREALALLERLNSRLGEKAVLRPQLRADAQPEFAYRYEPCLFLPSPLGGEGMGVRGSFSPLPQEGRGAGGEGVRDADGSLSPPPLTPTLSPRSGGRGRKSIFPPSQQRRARKSISPLPQRGRGAGGEGMVRPPCLQGRPVSVAVLSIFPGGPPIRFEWQEKLYIVERFWGPERIETGWWRGDDIRRDYYLVETTAGERFWLFRTLPEEWWFLHGVFG